MKYPLLLILFGLPGAGKSYAGHLLRDDFGFYFHESDEDIPDDYRRLVAAGQVVSDERRDEFHRRLLDRMAALAGEHPRLAVAVPLLRQKHRDWIKARFPHAHFVLVEVDPLLWEARLAGRTHTVGADYARKIRPLYEPPTVAHVVLDSSTPGAEPIRQQLRTLLTTLEKPFKASLH